MKHVDKCAVISFTTTVYNNESFLTVSVQMPLWAGHSLGKPLPGQAHSLGRPLPGKATSCAGSLW